MVISLVVAYLVSAMTSVQPKSDETIDFKVKKSDVFRKEIYILSAFFIVILVFSYFVPQIFGR